ncbi:type I restriction enzyme S subunit [Klebsiella sp. SORGH_AS 826]|nr:restriction endonuclease subunit S [Klebsiella sp. SORGH_AS_0826]MDR6262074.1 type I restriction enzyme S subunit [Klebsiella sp. SORGH_AS_0826]
MDAKQFLAEFGHIADAPGGIGKLRELILSLAFKGLLCPPSNETSASLLDEIERQRLDFNGETRKQRLTRQGNTTANSVAPYEIPKHWSWVSLSTVGHTWGQKKPLNSFNYIDVSSIDNKTGVVSHSSQVISASAAPSRARKVVKKGTLIYSTVRPYLLNIAIIDRDFEFEPIASTAFAIIHPWEGILGRYLYFYLRSPIFVMYVESVQTGMAYPAISDEKFYSGVVPLPPTEEQSRIVAKVDELMALCDKLDEQLQSRRTLQNALRQSTMQAIASATSPQELQINWTRLADNFGKLFHAPEDVSDLRKLASELAIRGVLDTNHQPADTSSVDVYLAELGRKKSGKRFAKSVQPDEAFSLPNGWRWVLLEDLLSGSESGWSPKCEAEPRREGEWGVLKVSAVTWGAFDPNENKRLPLSLEARPECAVKPGDFMLSRANTAELVARSVIAPEDCPEKLLMSDKIVRLNFLDDALKPWVNLVNNSVFFSCVL